MKADLFCDRCGKLYLEHRLDLHHLVPRKKLKRISDMKNNNFVDLWMEMSKCIVLCQRCHSNVHRNMRRGLPVLG